MLRPWVAVAAAVATAGVADAEGRFLQGLLAARGASEAHQEPDVETTPHPVAGNAPEAIGNIMHYQIQQPTPIPAAFNGVYCRGGACQYRVPPPVPITIFPTPFPNVPYGINKREFCRGLGCIPMMGWPANVKMDGFTLNCDHLYNHVGGGMKGHDDNRTVVEVRDSFLAWCHKRVGPLEVGACPAYADVAVAGASAAVDEISVGDTKQVCNNMFLFTDAAKKAEVQLKLVKEALPSSHGASLLSVALNRFGTGGNGPNSPRGRRWKAYAWEHFGQNAAARAIDAAEGVQPLSPPRDEAAMLQWKSAVWGGEKARCASEWPDDPPDGSEDPNDPRGLPQYNPRAPCVHGVNEVPQSGTKYQIAPGSPDGSVGPVEVDGDVFTYCQNQMSEIMLGFAQTGSMTVTMLKDWCRWQCSVTTWVGKKEEYGHPDWTIRDCEGMANFVSYALRDDLDSEKGLSSHNVCAKLFGAQGAVKRVGELVQDAWTVSLRQPPTLATTTDLGNDEEIKAALAAAQAYADDVFSKMRAQKDAFDDLNSAKMETEAFDPSPPQAHGPALPSSADFDPASISLAVVASPRLRRWGSDGGGRA